jgi:predicted esterase
MVVLDQPAAPGSLAGRHVLVCNGTFDPIVPPDHPARLAALLRAGGAAVTVRALPASHQLTPQDVAAAQEWLAKR